MGVHERAWAGAVFGRHKHLDALVLKLLPRLHIDRNRASHRLGVREDLQRLGSNLFGRPPAVIECDDWIEKAAWWRNQ